MIKVEIFRNQNNEIYGFRVDNHGDSIVCAGVSALALNCVNCIEHFTEEHFICDFNETDGGFLKIEVIPIKEGQHDHDVNLIFNCFLLGIQAIHAENKKHIKIVDKEVQELC